MDGPRFIPFETNELARALLLIRLRDRCPPPPPPIPSCPCRPCPDTFERAEYPVLFSTYLERQNQEHRAAREHDRLCEAAAVADRPDRPTAREIGRDPDEVAARLGSADLAAKTGNGIASAASPHPSPKPRMVYHQQLPSPTGRVIDLFI